MPNPAEAPPTTLTDFLLARLSEDEAVIKSAPHPPWIDDSGTPASAVFSVGDDSYVTDPHDWNMVGSTTAYMAQFDPARLLAECGAKRRIVEAFERVDSNEQSPDYELGYGLDLAVRELAAAYADHPDYRADWRP